MRHLGRRASARACQVKYKSRRYQRTKNQRKQTLKPDMVAAPGLEPGCRSRAADFKSAGQPFAKFLCGHAFRPESAEILVSQAEID
jgi:hypothetical protein